MKELRKAKGVTQQQLADYCGVHRDTIIYVENNRYCPSVNLAATIAEFLGASIEEIFIFGPGSPDTKKATREETAKRKCEHEKNDSLFKIRRIIRKWQYIIAR